MRNVSIINYEALVEVYNSWLDLFMLSPSKYEKMELLSSAVMSFSDHHLSLFGEDDSETVLNANLYMLDGLLKVEELLKHPEFNSLAEENYLLTSDCSNAIVENGLEEFCGDLIPEMYLNAYRIGRVYQKSKMRQGM